jgi:hypothetical protein
MGANACISWYTSNSNTTLLQTSEHTCN